MKQEKQSEWLAKNSPYRYHRSRRSQFSIGDCCGHQPEKTGRCILHDDPDSGELRWFSLYRCGICGANYIGLNGRWKQIENPLRYEQKQEEGEQP